MTINHPIKCLYSWITQIEHGILIHLLSFSRIELNGKHRQFHPDDFRAFYLRQDWTCLIPSLQFKMLSSQHWTARAPEGHAWPAWGQRSPRFRRMVSEEGWDTLTLLVYWSPHKRIGYTVMKGSWGMLREDERRISSWISHLASSEDILGKVSSFHLGNS